MAIAQNSPLDYLDKEQILELRIRDLNLSLESTPYYKLCLKLHHELAKKGLNFRPHFWASDEWFSPDGIGGVAIPFYLFHPRLIELEKEFMGEAEGEDPRDFLRLLRHECGHALDNAFHLRKNKSRQKIFGRPGLTYPKSYLPDPKSKYFVRHLKNHYAQAHPEEDWAETFAVWLTDNSWKSIYKNWPCIEKLNFMDQLMKKLKDKKPLNTKQTTYNHARNLNISLKDYYKTKTKQYRINRCYFAKESKDLFTDLPSKITAQKYLRTQRKFLISSLNTRLKRPVSEVKPLIQEFENSTKTLYINNLDPKINSQILAIIESKSHNYYKKGLHRIIM